MNITQRVSVTGGMTAEGDKASLSQEFAAWAATVPKRPMPVRYTLRRLYEGWPSPVVSKASYDHFLPLYVASITQAQQQQVSNQYTASLIPWLHKQDGAYHINLGPNNWSEYHPARTEWQKVRLVSKPAKGDKRVLVDLTDSRFSVSNGKTSVAHNLKTIAWGTAADCRIGAQSKLSLDLRDTPFRPESDQPVTPIGGTASNGKPSCTEGQQVCTAACGGWCGYCGIANLHQLEKVVLLVSDPAWSDAYAEPKVCSLPSMVTRGAALDRVSDNLADYCGHERHKCLGPIADVSDPDYLTGEYPVDYGWDAAELATEPGTIAAYRKAVLTHTRWTVLCGDEWISVDGQTMQIISTRNRAAAPWKDMHVEIVIEGTGAFNSLEGFSKHIEADAKKIVITAHGKNCPTGTSHCLTPEWVTQYTDAQINEPVWLKPGARIFSGGNLDYHDDSNLLQAQYIAATVACHVALMGDFGTYRVHGGPPRRDLHLLRPGEAFDPLVRTDGSRTAAGPSPTCSDGTCRPSRLMRIPLRAGPPKSPWPPSVSYPQ